MSGLLSSDEYEHRTCGMHRDLLSQVRLAMQALPTDSALADQLCQKVLDLLPEGDAAVMLSPAMGKPFAQAVRGEPAVVVWLLPDPTDVDSKQTTFVRTGMKNLEETFSAVYKLPGPEGKTP